jgi:hypothetical protein
MSIQETERVVGSGLVVFHDDAVIEGRTLWLESPDEVLDWMDTGDVEETIAIVRGGTTTFLTPALNAGVKGVITLQGATNTHLGIVSREYGIPCLMSVQFSEGVRTSRGEAIPPDGTLIRMDISGDPGHILVPEGVVLGEAVEVDESAGAEPDEATKELMRLIAAYKGEVPHGPEGEQIMQSRQKTQVLTLTDESLAPDLLTRDQVNDMVDFMGWSFWDWLAERADEGESTLIPRPQYESLGLLQMWHGLPRFYRAITEEVGRDGVEEIGAIFRREIGTKVKMIQIHSTGMGPVFGRGVALELGQHSHDHRAEDLQLSLQFMRRLYRGFWNDNGPVFSSTRGYHARVLEQHWIDRFVEERLSDEGDPERRTFFQKFNGATELLAFLSHFDNRLGVGDTGPYPVPGGWLIVRDLILNDDSYEWSKVLGDDVPFAVTQAMFFTDEPPIEKSITEGGTLFTKPPNYLTNLHGFAAYARDKWDTPVSQVRHLSESDMSDLQGKVQQAASRMYEYIVGLTDEQKIRSGLQVYGFDYATPFARAAGLYDKLIAEGYGKVDPLTEEAWQYLVTDGKAVETVVKLFTSGSGFQPLP